MQSLVTAPARVLKELLTLHRFVQNKEITYGPVRLNGRDDMKLIALKLNGAPLPSADFELTDDTLTIHSPPKEAFEVLNACLAPLFACCCAPPPVYARSYPQPVHIQSSCWLLQCCCAAASLCAELASSCNTAG